MPLEDAPSDPDVDPAYLTHFRQHVRQTQFHLQGLDPSSDAPPPFYTENPTSYWTSAEKSAFFHGLSVYSRLRPDLIAESVQTKNVIEVCTYIDMLDEGLKDAALGSRLQREKIEGAMEVSEEWIELEEYHAEGILSTEKKWAETAAATAREDERKSMKKDMNPRATKGDGKTQADRERERTEFKEWEKAQRIAWQKEDMLKSLEAAHCKVVDHILRDFEEASSLSLQNSGDLSQPAALEDNESMIDPALRSPASGSSRAAAPAVASIPDNLSPDSRRRLRKRLWMRRKREQAKGNTDLPTVGSSLDLERVKPGRKSLPRKKRKTENGSQTQVPEDDDDDGDDEVDPRHRHVGGKTQHYKIKAQFEKMGIDAAALNQHGLGLFHMSALAKVMKMYNLLSDIPSSTSCEISADVIQFLHAHVVQYVTELVHRTIVSREQERGMKEHTKVWKFNSEQILAPNVERAKEMMGDHFESKKSFFDAIFERSNVLSDEPESDSALASSENGESEDDGAGPESEEDVPAVVGVKQRPLGTVLSPDLYRCIYEPLVRLPPILGGSTPPYVHQGHSPVTSPSSIEQDQSLLALDMDEKLLFEELRAEVELDNRDRAEAEKNERVLWGEYGRRRVSNASKAAVKTEEVEDDAHAHALRYKAPEVDGQIKSAVFVDDSD